MAGNQKKTLILVVDDHKAARELVCRMLKSLGYHTIAAKDGIEALGCLTNGGNIDFVLTDINMPNMDGWELARHIKALDPSLPIVALTGEAPNNINPRLSGSGIRQALFKPFNLDDLKSAITVLGKSEQE